MAFVETDCDVERAAGKGVDEAGPERSGGVQLTGTTKQRKKKERGCRQGLRTTTVKALNENENENENDTMVTMLSKGRDGRFIFAEGR